MTRSVVPSLCVIYDIHTVIYMCYFSSYCSVKYKKTTCTSVYPSGQRRTLWPRPRRGVYCSQVSRCGRACKDWRAARGFAKLTILLLFLCLPDPLLHDWSTSGTLESRRGRIKVSLTRQARTHVTGFVIIIIKTSLFRGK